MRSDPWSVYMGRFWELGCIRSCLLDFKSQWNSETYAWAFKKKLKRKPLSSNFQNIFLKILLATNYLDLEWFSFFSGRKRGLSSSRPLLLWLMVGTKQVLSSVGCFMAKLLNIPESAIITFLLFSNNTTLQLMLAERPNSNIAVIQPKHKPIFLLWGRMLSISIFR